MTDEGLSRSVEDYLKAVYALTERGAPASTSALAAALDVQPSSVSGMMKRLAEAGYVRHRRYRGVQLTETGRTTALSVIRRHRILETYLVERLGYAWEDVHDEAERLEHAASDELIERMAGALENPSHDPHGAPIPSASGDIEVIDHGVLADASAGDRVEIRAVTDEDADRLRYLDELGLKPGVRLTVQEAAPFDGPLSVRLEGAETPLIVGRDIARRIFVSEVES